MNRSARAPSPPALPALGHALAFRRDPLAFLLATAQRCGPVARLRVGALEYHLVSEPALIAEVLQTRAANYARDTRSSRSIRLVTGESLLSTEGEPWRRHRRLIQPVFHQRRLVALADTMTQACRETLARWREASRAGTVLDLASEMNRLTFSIVGRCLFGSELGDRAETVERHFPLLLEELFRRARTLFALPPWVPTPRHLRFRAALSAIDGIVDDIIAARRRAAVDRDDLLGLLLQTRDEDDSPLSAEEIRNHVITFLLAGHETTASTLTWTLSLLAQKPAAREAIEEQLDATLQGGAPTWETLPRLTHLDAALHEALRLYPAIWICERRVMAADTLGGFTIPANSAVVVSAHVTQRLPALWPEPAAFRPERFAEAAPRPGLDHGYFPFGAGPHQCIGQHFALLEARIALAMLLASFRVRLTDTFPLPLAGITLRPAGAVPVRIEAR